MSLVEVKNAVFAYGSENIFEDINFQLNKGEVLCLLGPNGCGKTTLLDCILGLLRLKSGDIFLNDKNINDLKTHQIARSIAYVPQMHQKTFPYRVIDVVLMGRASYTTLFSSPSSEDIDIAENALEQVGIIKLKDRPYTQLSGGQGQLVMLARALTQNAPMLVMDEPTAHLDFKHELNVLETVIHLVHEKKLSIIMATHFPNHALSFENNGINTSVAMMNEKRFAAFGLPSQVLCEDNMRKIFNINSKVIKYSIDMKKELNYIIPLNTLT
jgi:iron complex transport system ATP-binding protein